MQQDPPGVVITDAANQAADLHFATAAHEIFASLVRDGAALGWVGPPTLAEVTALLRSVGEAAAAGNGALRAAYLLRPPPGGLPAQARACFIIPGRSGSGSSAPGWQGGVGADSGAIGDDGNAASRDTGTREPAWGFETSPSPPPPSQLIGLGYWTRYERPTHQPHANVRHIAVAARAQGHGAGRALTRALIQSARAAGIEVLTLDARGDNAGALRLYRSLGFREYGRLHNFVAVGQRRYDTVLCALDLREQAEGRAPDAPA